MNWRDRFTAWLRCMLYGGHDVPAGQIGEHVQCTRCGSWWASTGSDRVRVAPPPPKPGREPAISKYLNREFRCCDRQDIRGMGFFPPDTRGQCQACGKIFEDWH